MATVTYRDDNSTYNVLYKEGILRKLFDDTAGKALTFADQLYNKLASKEAWVLDQQHAMLNGINELVEGESIPAQKPVIGAQKKYEMRRFGTGFRMTDKAIKFNKVSYWDKLTKNLSKVMKEGIDIELHVVWNNPTSTSLICGVGFDTLALASASHTGLLAGSTSDNYSNYGNAALTYTSLESARYYFKTKKNALGQLISMVPDTLLFEPTLEPTVHELLKSDNKAWEFSNTSNFYTSMGLKMVPDPRISSTTRWYMLAKNSEYYDMNYFVAYEPDFVTQDAPDTSRDRLATSQTYISYGWGSPAAIYVGY